MADQIKQIKEFPQKPDFGDDDLLLIQGQGTTYNVQGRAVKKYAEDSAKPQVALAAQEAQAAAAAADRAEAAIQHPAIPDPATGNWQVWDQVSGSYQETVPPVRAEGQDFEIKGYYPTLKALEAAVPSPEKGYAYGIGTEAPYDIYVWDAAHGIWVNNGPMTASGDMLKSTYDPQHKNQDVFAYAESVGLPAGGTTGQIPVKTSSEDRDVTWQDLSAVGVTSFKGRTGAVAPASGDYSVSQVTGAAPKESPVFTGSISLGRKSSTTVGLRSIAAGTNTSAIGTGSSAFGQETIARGDYSFASGIEGTEAIGKGSVALGCGTVAVDWGEVAVGQYNTRKTSNPVSVFGDYFVVGRGYGKEVAYRRNAFRVSDKGIFGFTTFNSSGADYAALFEWVDGNHKKENRIGRFVTLEGRNIRLAGPGDDFLLGIISGNPAFLEDAYEDEWNRKYLTDIFGRPIWEDVEVPAVMEEVEVPVEAPGEGDEAAPVGIRMETRVVIPAHTERRQKLNPDYDPAQPYVPRTERPEWDAVGMMGKLVAVDDGTCRANGWATVGEGGAATASAERTRFRVMERLDESHVRILILVS